MDSKLCDIQSSDEGHALDEKMETLQVDLAHKEASIKIINEEIIDGNEIDENTQIYKEILMNELREAEILKAHLKKMEVDRTNNMGPNEKTFETNLKKLKVEGEAYFGADNFVKVPKRVIPQCFFSSKNSTPRKKSIFNDLEGYEKKNRLIFPKSFLDWPVSELKNDVLFDPV